MIKKIMNRNLKTGRPNLLCLLVTLCAIELFVSVTAACQVPVFRYALERWSPDAYRIYLLAAGGLTSAQQEKVELLKRSKRVQVEVIDTAKPLTGFAGSLARKYGKDQQSQWCIFYPAKAAALRDQVAHVLDGEKDVTSVLDSPVRAEIAKRLALGHSAVWVLLESGNSQKDERARRVLEEQLRKDEAWVKLPSPEELEVQPEVLDKVKIKLRVEFSVVTLKRDDSKEQFLVNSLLNSESDLREFDEPIAFPVFGRGLVLYALVGSGIMPDTIRKASAFVAGPCSCQVKEQNPGFDLLLEYAWEEAVGEVMISQPIPGNNLVAEPNTIPIPAGRKK